MIKRTDNKNEIAFVHGKDDGNFAFTFPTISTPLSVAMMKDVKMPVKPFERLAKRLSKQMKVDGIVFTAVSFYTLIRQE